MSIDFRFFRVMFLYLIVFRLIASEENMSESALPPISFSTGDGYVPMNVEHHYVNEARV